MRVYQLLRHEGRHQHCDAFDAAHEAIEEYGRWLAREYVQARPIFADVEILTEQGPRLMDKATVLASEEYLDRVDVPGLEETEALLRVAHDCAESIIDRMNDHMHRADECNHDDCLDADSHECACGCDVPEEPTSGESHDEDCIQPFRLQEELGLPTENHASVEEIAEEITDSLGYTRPGARLRAMESKAYQRGRTDEAAEWCRAGSIIGPTPKAQFKAKMDQWYRDKLEEARKEARWNVLHNLGVAPVGYYGSRVPVSLEDYLRIIGEVKAQYLKGAAIPD